ncbi:YdcF family protein [Methylocystis bryophila]|uniref:DUF218 domain-containing protein n=1 Tax=Methylocystis bryophila TaxID=655015 RepID=A0A1W6MW66_9HYPH|nr:ElyC/SanA/YdcF family protein [Methylocystis bryophila]ARN81848.1 hypothetical protein B1812_13005 [Methylocystis bryophila]BDV37922.1 hypothetical protein DSM21852_11750 [Methylocystis bryophila]
MTANFARPPSLLVLALSLIFCALASFASELLQFDAFSPPSEAAVKRAAAAIVFTGDFARIDEALALLAKGRVHRVFISGVNGGAGLDKQSFVAQFAQRNPKLASLDRLVACCVEMGEAAENTIQNALETQCWLKDRAVSGPLLLITSRTHMARALALLARAAPNHALIAYPVEDGLSEEGRSEEYLKFVETLVLLRLPDVVGRSRFSGLFAGGCPPSS